MNIKDKSRGQDLPSVDKDDQSNVSPDHQGLHSRRYVNNPIEKVFALQWQQENDRQHTPLLAWLLGDGTKPSPIDEREASVAATIIQWLGSPVGADFLYTVFKKIEAKCTNHVSPCSCNSCTFLRNVRCND